jgi:hypothetical protein
MKKVGSNAPKRMHREGMCRLNAEPQNYITPQDNKLAKYLS